MRFSLIGIDVGTTATKAVLIGEAGKALAHFARPHATNRAGNGMAEQDPAAWMDSVHAALEHFASVTDPSSIRGIGLCSQVNTHVFVGSDGRALRPAITWQDTRAAQDAERLDAQVSAAQKTAWFGGPVPIDASHALSRMAWVARTEPETWRETRFVLLPKDFCTLALTGELVGDSIAAVGLVDTDGGYVSDLLDLVPGAAAKLPPLFAFHHVAGHVRPGLPCAGVPVVVGAMDAWGGMFGCGVVSDGEAMYQSGTSEIPGIISSRVVPTPGVVLFPPYQELRMHAAPTQSGGASFAWVSMLLGQTPDALAALADTAPHSGTIPIFLPHLGGERAPIWDAAARGTFARIDGSVGAGQLARSVMEGVAFSVRWAFEALQHSADVRISKARISGGGARSDVWCQIRSDVLGMTLERTSVPDAAALGAAILAGLGSGAFSRLTDAAASLVRVERVFEPGAAGAYDEAYGHFRALYEATAPFNRRFT